MADLTTAVKDGETLELAYNVVNTSPHVGRQQQVELLAPDGTVIDNDAILLQAGGSERGVLRTSALNKTDDGYQTTYKVVSEESSKTVLVYIGIPDNDGFEHNDLSTLYGGATETGTFNIQTGTVFEQDFALASNGTNEEMVVRNDGPFGRKFSVDYRFYVESDASTEDSAIAFPTSVVGDRANMSGYTVYHMGRDNQIIIRKFTAGSLISSVSANVAIPSNTWNNFTIEVNTTGIVFDPNGVNLTLTDNEYTGVYYGFIDYSGVTYWDDLVFTKL